MELQNKRVYDSESYILIVDDDDTLLKFFKIHLNKRFSKIIVVKNAKEAIDTLKEKNIDLVLSDVRMPRVDGLELLAKIRKFDPLIPVLMVSGAMLTDEQTEACKNADGYLRKPFSVDDLHNFIYDGIEKRTKLNRLADLVGDRKATRDILKGKIKMKITKGDAEIKEAQDLLNQLLSKAS